MTGRGGADADGLGIDLNGDGVTANDGGDSDSNAKQNFPVITAAVATSLRVGNLQRRRQQPYHRFDCGIV